MRYVFVTQMFFSYYTELYMETFDTQIFIFHYNQRRFKQAFYVRLK